MITHSRYYFALKCFIGFRIRLPYCYVLNVLSVAAAVVDASAKLFFYKFLKVIHAVVVVLLVQQFRSLRILTWNTASGSVTQFAKLTGKKSAPLPWYVWWPKLTALSCLFVYLSTVFVLSIKRIKLVKRFLIFYFICLHIICSKGGPDWSKRDQPSPVLNILPNR